MNTKQAWIFIRSKFQRYAETGRKNAWNETGICNAILRLEHEGEIIPAQVVVMGADMIKAARKRQDPFYGYWFPRTREGAAERVKLIDRILKTHKGVEKK